MQYHYPFFVKRFNFYNEHSIQAKSLFVYEEIYNAHIFMKYREYT